MNSEIEAAQPYTFEELEDLAYGKIEAISTARLVASPASTVASVLNDLPIDECRALLRLISIEQASEILAEMRQEMSAEVISAMRESRAVQIIETLDPDDAADLLNELDDDIRDRLLEKIDDKSRTEVDRLLSYDSETAGGVMTTEVMTLSPDLTIDQAIGEVRRLSEEIESVYYIYVVDEERRLLGVVSMRQLLLSKSHLKVRDIMVTEVHGRCSVDDDREKVAHELMAHNLIALPVTDEDNRLLGIVTHDDVMDIIRDEATEDFQKLVGAGRDESINDPIAESLRKRAPWLVVNLMTAAIGAFIISIFEPTIEALPLLAVFMPAVASLGGNTGSQTLAVTIRSLALGTIRPDDMFRVCLRESFKGLLNGLVVGLIASLAIFATTGNLAIGVTVYFAMMMTMIFAGLSGSLIPLTLKSLKLDPAQSSTIFLTAVTDISAFFIFLKLGTLLVL
ncbi:MAG: magnesium transporter [Puniceicoccaceae bacterium]